jgi:hypothetical protein
MTWLARLWGRLLQRPHPMELPPVPVDGIQLTAAELERVMGVWTRWWAQSEGDESDEQLAVMGRRVEKELQTYFGQDTWQRVQATKGNGGGGTILLAADQLFVAFLGTRAAMAVTRKLYSNLR